MNVYRRARELGWDVKLIRAKAPYEYEVRRDGWFRTGGPPADTHYARGKKDLESLLLAIEAGESTDRWREPH